MTPGVVIGIDWHKPYGELSFLWTW